MKLPRNADLWLPAYLRDRARRVTDAGKPERLWVAFTDHFEPCGNATLPVARQRMAAWQQLWPAIADAAPRDAHGRPPCYTFFYPQEEYNREILDSITEITRTGFADVEVHLHHFDDTAPSFVDKVRDFTARLHNDHGLLHMHNGRLVFGFIHGNWALDNSRPDGKACGVTGELQLLRDLGCYADFTMPSTPSPTQSRIVNRIYWTTGDPARPRGFDSGIEATVGGGTRGDLLMITGPLGLRFRDRLIPRVETGELACYDPPTPYRVQRWIDLAPRIGDNIFLKLYGHSAREDNATALLGKGDTPGALAPMFRWINQAAQQRNLELNWVSAYQMFCAIESLVQIPRLQPGIAGEARLQTAGIGRQIGNVDRFEARKPGSAAPTLSGNPGLVKTAAQGIYLLICIETLFSVPFRSIYLARHSLPASWIASVCVLAGIALCLPSRLSILSHLRRLLSAPALNDRVWLTLWLVIGLALRLAWALRFPITLKSDNLAYFGIARDFAHGDAGTGAYWPPGFSLFLAPFFMLFGAHVWVTTLCCLLLFAGLYLLTYLLAMRTQCSFSARLAPMLIALWPCDIMLTGTNSKETFLAVLVPATLLLQLKASGDPEQSHSRAKGPQLDHAATHWGFVLAAGICMGVAALTQPGFLLFPAAIFVFELLRSGGLVTAGVRTAVFFLAMLVAISPWTYRNYRAFHHFVPIATNGGYVFEAANSASSDPFSAPEAEISLPQDEIAANRLGYQAGEDWIKQNPGRFAALMVKKQVVTVGDDGIGAYESLKRNLNPGTALYASAKGISNLYWLALWTLMLLGFSLLFDCPDWGLWFGLLFVPTFYQWVIDSIFVSGSRHHLPYMSLSAIIVGIVLDAARSMSAVSAREGADTAGVAHP